MRSRAHHSNNTKYLSVRYCCTGDSPSAVSNRVAEKCLTHTRHIALWAPAFCLAHCSGLGFIVQAGFTGFLNTNELFQLFPVILWKPCLVSPFYFPLLSKQSLHWEITIDLMCSSNDSGPPLAIYFPGTFKGEETLKCYYWEVQSKAHCSSPLISVLDAQCAGSEGS